MNSSTLQSLMAFNAQQINAAQCFYISYKDILKDFRECGKSDDEAYARYKKAAEKELKKLHLLERNQKSLIQELRAVYDAEDIERLLAWEDNYV